MIVLLATSCGGSPTDRARSVLEAGRRGGAEAEASILSRAGDPSPIVRAAVVAALTESNTAEAASVRLAALEDPSETVRAAAATSLGDGGRVEAIGRLGRCAASDPSPAVRRRAVDAIARLGRVDGSAVLLLPALEDPDPGVRRGAAEALQGLDPGSVPDAAPAIAKRLAEDPVWEVRSAAAAALAATLLPGAWAPLEGALRDPNEFVRAAASRGLKSLGRAGVPRDEAPSPEVTTEDDVGGRSGV